MTSKQAAAPATTRAKARGARAVPREQDMGNSLVFPVVVVLLPGPFSSVGPSNWPVRWLEPRLLGLGLHAQRHRPPSGHPTARCLSSWLASLRRLRFSSRSAWAILVCSSCKRVCSSLQTGLLRQPLPAAPRSFSLPRSSALHLSARCEASCIAGRRVS